MNPFRISPDDHAPMEVFALKWRWTELSLSELQRIKPLSSSKAEAAWKLSRTWHSTDVYDSRPALWADMAELRAPDPGAGSTWLAARLKGTAPIIVTWQHDWAVETDTDLFVRRWDTFCYPGSDDVDVFPLSLDWLVTYGHEEHFFFRKRRASTKA